MPTISFSLRNMQALLKRKITSQELPELLSSVKADFEDFDAGSDEVRADFGDTNMPYLWSAEGTARLLKGLAGKEIGLPELKVAKSTYKILVEGSVTKVRPFIAAFVAKECVIDDYTIKQLIQSQEKLCETYGMKRKKVSIGLYSQEKIVYPVHYKAVVPNKTSFIPLEQKKEMTLKDILKELPKGKEYAYILEGQQKYPILMDSAKSILSFPPIINSHETGKVSEKDKELLVEVTGEDEDAVNLACNILAFDMQDKGWKIFSVEVKYPSKKVSTPLMFNETIKITPDEVNKALGTSIKEPDLKRLLGKMRYGYANGKVLIPSYRKDILHAVDIIEDVAIAYGYNNLPETPLTSFTVGSLRKINNFIDKLRELLVGLGYQEVMRPLLSNKNLLYNLMEIEDTGTVELQNPGSEQFSVLRTWITPLLMDMLSRNKHVEYPQSLFEQGLVTVKDEGRIIDYEHLAAITIAEKADYTVIKQALDAVFRGIGIDYAIQETDHNSFIEGRVGTILVKGTKIGFIGELHPKVLANFNLEMPVVSFELNVTELFKII